MDRAVPISILVVGGAQPVVRQDEVAHVSETLVGERAVPEEEVDVPGQEGGGGGVGVSESACSRAARHGTPVAETTYCPPWHWHVARLGRPTVAPTVSHVYHSHTRMAVRVTHIGLMQKRSFGAFSSTTRIASMTVGGVWYGQRCKG